MYPAIFQIGLKNKQQNQSKNNCNKNKYGHFLIANFLILLMLIAAHANAQNSARSDDPQVTKTYSNLFLNGKISYNDIPQDVLRKIISARYSDRTGAWNLGTFESIIAANYFVQGEGVVEVRSGGNIYSWPIASSSRDKSIVFYAQGVDPNSIFNTTVVHGMHVSTAAANLNMVKIGEQTAPVSSCFDEPDFGKAELVLPRQYLKFQEEGDYLMLSYTLAFPEVSSVVYTEPKSVIFAGQLVEVNSGINYDVRMREVSGLSLFDTKTMKTIPSSTLHLKGIQQPKLEYSNNHIYYYNESDYGCMFPENFYNGYLLKSSVINVMSQDGTPIYILSTNKSKLEVESLIYPDDGDVICDLQETSKYICYCGSNKKHGYVGYENPVLVIIDKETKKVVARYNGNDGKGKKDRFFNKMYVLDDDHLLMMYNDYHYREETSWNYEIVTISSTVVNYKTEEELNPSFLEEQYGQAGVDEEYNDNNDENYEDNSEMQNNEEASNNGWVKYVIILLLFVVASYFAVLFFKKRTKKGIGNDSTIKTLSVFIITTTMLFISVGEMKAQHNKEKECVDLGLPSGILWATSNLGAHGSRDYIGGYFAWGETKAKNAFRWCDNYEPFDYKYGKAGLTITKYCSNPKYGYNGYSDNLIVLEPEDDAATIKLGDGWRIPTYEDWMELITICSSKQVEYDRGGLKGWLFTAPNGNTLFLPNPYGIDGGYWSSSLNPEVPHSAWCFDSNYDGHGMYYYFRAYGRHIRPVYSGKTNQSRTNSSPTSNQSVSPQSTNTIQQTKVYSNAYDGFVNIRQAPQSKAPILGVLRNGPEGAILLGSEGEWKKIDCNGIVGYVFGKYVQDTPTEVFHGE